MLNFEIISKVHFEPISQEYIEELLREAITKQNPEVYVNSFTFTQRRSPACIEVTVDAQLGAPTQTKVEDAQVKEEETEEELGSTEELDTGSEEGSTETTDDTQPQSIADIFGG